MRLRTVSALVAAGILIAVYLLFDTRGLYGICSFVALGCIYEYSRLTLTKLKASIHLRIWFMILATALYVITVKWIDSSILAAAICSILFLSVVLVQVRKTPDLPYALQLQTAGLMGFFYCGIFPGLCVHVLGMGVTGPIWLLGLLAIVFTGDTFAYLTGRLFGKHKLLEAVSPKKTIEGSIGGLGGSALAGLVLGLYFLPEVPLWGLVLTALVTGLFAQVGDLFESLLKRIADVKDSGAIMPGHGGILDRVDGVLFAAPIYYVLARFLH
ncbi:MAG: phosphatidate cytidylyltransferase [Bdellovibrionota bacterium]